MILADFESAVIEHTPNFGPDKPCGEFDPSKVVTYRQDSIPFDLWIEVCRFYDFEPSLPNLIVLRGSEPHVYLETMLQIRRGVRPRFKLS